MRDKRVFIAMPYAGRGEEVTVNVRAAIAVGEAILQQTTDWLPFVPHLFHLWHLINPHPPAFWMEMDGDWLHACQALVRVGSESEGADRDMNLAADLAIPVFITLDEFLRYALLLPLYPKDEE